MSVTQWADAPGTSNVVGRVPPAVHRFVKADLEQLVALRPDLVVVSEYTDADFMKQVERSGLRVHRMLGLATLAGCAARSWTWAAPSAKTRPRGASWPSSTARSRSSLAASPGRASRACSTGRAT